MSAEATYKFQPDRTLYLRGFTGFGSAAALCEASSTGFKVQGVFRDMADFCVLVIYDADNSFEHYSVRYLPDFDLSGITLSFDLTYNGLQPIDSAKYSWIDWSQLDVVKVDSATGIDDVPPPNTTYQQRLWDHATLKSGDYAVAQGTYRISAPGNCSDYDRLTLFVNNIPFDFIADPAGQPKKSAASVAQFLADSINGFDWSGFQGHSVSCVTAATDGQGGLTLKNGRSGHVQFSGTSVSWVDGVKFTGIAPGSLLYLNGGMQGYTVASVVSPTSLILTSPAPVTNSAPVPYLAEYGGVDGNSVTTYMLVRPTNQTLAVDKTVVQLSGGNSDGVTWSVSIDFTALQIDHLRQAWLTFAPQLTAGSEYQDTEWTATFTNWTVTSTSDNTKLLCAAPSSVRIGNDEHTACTFSGSGWSTVATNNYWRGFGRQASIAGDSVTITYTCASIHDLYLGTSLASSRGQVDVSLDGDAHTSLDCYLPSYAEVVARRLLRRSVGPGTHTLVLTLKISGPDQFLFDFLEAAVPGEIPAPLVTYNNVSPALDYDTDATYKVSPQRLLWHLTKLGFAGQINEYLGVFWWNQRKRVNSIWKSVQVNFSGHWTADDTATLTFDDTVILEKLVTTWDTVDTIAEHFAYFINAGSIIIRAGKTGPGQLTIYTRTPNWQVKFAASAKSIDGVLSTDAKSWDQSSGGLTEDPVPLSYGRDGEWQVDPSVDNPLNFGARQWHSDFFACAKNQNLLVTTSFSMELVNPPADDRTSANTWCARYDLLDDKASLVETDTGFSNLASTQCAPVPNFTAFQGRAFTAMAALQAEAGLKPWLQFGEFLWWFFSSMSQPVGYCAFTEPISIGLAAPHGMLTGDRVVITGVRGCPAANGTWPIQVVDETHFTIAVPANGEWVPGTGWVRGGSMALYDAATSTLAQITLGRPLYRFTCQDDDPTVNDGADAAFLADRLKAHVDGIRSAVLSEYPEAQFEILFPNDVNNPKCHLGPDVAYPQGGRLNAAVNLPAAWHNKETSGFDRFKVEALSWGAQYLNLDLAEEAINLAMTPPFSWPVEDVAYLVPWFNGTCPWRHEYHSAATRGVGLINFWAYDHLALMSWPLPFTSPVRRSFRKS